ncbi:MAG: hypothetical protein ABFS35_12830 [Bacteroidota bacterium]
MKTLLLVIIPFLFILHENSIAQNQSENPSTDFPKVKGSYLGQKPPGSLAQLFAPGIISTGLYTRDMAITPDGKEIYYCISSLGYNLIFYSKQVNGSWTEPQPAPFIDNYEYMYYEPCISHDGEKLFFLSDMPENENGKQGNQDIWVVDKEGENWGKPYNLGEPISTKNAEFFPSVTKEGTIYFTRQLKGERVNSIYRSKLVNGKYTEPERLPKQVNCGTNRFNAFVAPDETYIIVPAAGMKDSYGGANYYIVFRNKDDSWSEPINMGEEINKNLGRGWSPYISPDGKYFFFMSSKSVIKDKNSIKPSLKLFLEMHNQAGYGNSAIYWIDAKIIQDLKPKEIK